MWSYPSVVNAITVAVPVAVCYLSDEMKCMHIPSSASDCTSSTVCTSAVVTHIPEHRRERMSHE